jgi:hypothetical protein
MKRQMVWLLALLMTATLGAQTPRLSIAGDVPKAIALSLQDLEKLPQDSMTVDLEGQKVTFAGPAVHSVLGVAGVMFDDASRAAHRTRYVVVTGADDYAATYGMLEFDAAVSGAKAIVALQRNGQKLDAAEGPLRLITSGDKRPTRWVKQTVRIGIGRVAH